MVVFTEFTFVSEVVDLVVGLILEVEVLAPFTLDDIVIYLLVKLNFNVVSLRIGMVEEVFCGFVLNNLFEGVILVLSIFMVDEFFIE